MKIAMTLSKYNELLVPIIEGEVIRIYDTETNEYEDFANPALTLQSGKRGAVIRWLNDRKINILCVPPKMLCELSYEAAQKENFTYFRVESGTSFSEFIKLLENNGLEITTTLPENEIEPSFIPQVEE